MYAPMLLFFNIEDHVDSSIHEEVKELRKALKEKEEELKKLRQVHLFQ